MELALENNFCIILAGGKGRRLWPCSRKTRPKQFIDFFGTGRTQLQQTFDRFCKILPKENIFINTNAVYEGLVREQLPEVAADHIMAEPIYRNTAPSVAWAAHRIAKINPKANIIVSPSDQAVFNEESFRQNIMDGLAFVTRNNMLLTLGVKPTRPEPGYGYIQMGDNIDRDDVYKVRSFTEKPDREFAKIFMESDEFLWNTGLFLSNIHCMGMCMYKFLPAVLRTLDQDNPNASFEEENAFVQEHFPSYPNISLDHGLLEKTDKACVMKCDFGWADLGTWHSIFEAMQRSDEDNVVINSDVIMEDARNNIVKLPEGRLAVINGLDGYIIAEEDNVLLICKKEDSSSLVRKYVNEVQLKKGDKYI